MLTDRPPGGYLVVADDDVEFRGGDVADCVLLAHRAGLDLSQPTHELRSNRSHNITVGRAASALRRTNFVEIGPVLIASPQILSALLPLPNTTAMGWAADVEWTDLERAGFRFGALDAVRIRHLGMVAATYESVDEERAANRAALEARNLHGEWHRTYETVRPWRRHFAVPMRSASGDRRRR